MGRAVAEEELEGERGAHEYKGPRIVQAKDDPRAEEPHEQVNRLAERLAHRTGVAAPCDKASCRSSGVTLM